jgi:hypothetical protein
MHFLTAPTHAGSLFPKKALLWTAPLKAEKAKFYRIL